MHALVCMCWSEADLEDVVLSCQDLGDWIQDAGTFTHWAILSPVLFQYIMSSRLTLSEFYPGTGSSYFSKESCFLFVEGFSVNRRELLHSLDLCCPWAEVGLLWPPPHSLHSLLLACLSNVRLAQSWHVTRVPSTLAWHPGYLSPSPIPSLHPSSQVKTLGPGSIHLL